MKLYDKMVENYFVRRGTKMKSILLVDDVEINLDVLEAGLNHKYTIYTANSGHMALEALEEHPEIAAVITDIQMPKMDGVQLIKRIRETKGMESMVIFVSTAFGDLQMDTQVRSLGVDGVIYKPISTDALEARLDRALGGE